MALIEPDLTSTTNHSTMTSHCEATTMGVFCSVFSEKEIEKTWKNGYGRASAMLELGSATAGLGVFGSRPSSASMGATWRSISFWRRFNPKPKDGRLASLDLYGLTGGD